MTGQKPFSELAVGSFVGVGGGAADDEIVKGRWVDLLRECETENRRYRVPSLNYSHRHRLDCQT